MQMCISTLKNVANSHLLITFLSQMCVFSCILAKSCEKSKQWHCILLLAPQRYESRAKAGIKGDYMKKLDRWEMLRLHYYHGRCLFIVKSWEYASRKRPCVCAHTLTTDRWVTTCTGWVMDEQMNNSIRQAVFVFAALDSCKVAFIRSLHQGYCLKTVVRWRSRQTRLWQRKEESKQALKGKERFFSICSSSPRNLGAHQGQSYAGLRNKVSSMCFTRQYLP